MCNLFSFSFEVYFDLLLYNLGQLVQVYWMSFFTVINFQETDVFQVTQNPGLEYYRKWHEPCQMNHFNLWLFPWSTFLSNLADVKKYLQLSSWARFMTASSLNFRCDESKSHLFAAIIIGMLPWPKNSWMNDPAIHYEDPGRVCYNCKTYLLLFFLHLYKIFLFLVKRVHLRRNKREWIHRQIDNRLL